MLYNGCNENTPAPTLDDILGQLPKNETIVNNIIKGFSIIRNPEYKRICCTVSGGSDSDVVLDICCKLDVNKKITYCYFDTGMEYRATQRHLDELEKKYNIKIYRIRPSVPVPLAVKKYGQPFLDKNTSENLQRLQKIGFQWEDEEFDILLERYCKEFPAEKAIKNGKLKRGYVLHEGKYYRGAYNALAWWCNAKGEDSRFNISKTKYLKEFIISNPPWFKISNKCCYYSKKKIIQKLIVGEIDGLGSFDLIINGVRKYEGGCRKTAYKNCFTPYKSKRYKGENHTYSEYRPIFFYKQKDKKEYMEHCNIQCSDCYTTYGLLRTGCVGCCFGQNWKDELTAARKYEPSMFTAAQNLFKDSYIYMGMYEEFCKKWDYVFK